ncbi:MAG: hypothetical protein R2823_05870 [Acidimicrobiia bacterium]
MLSHRGRWRRWLDPAVDAVSVTFVSSLTVGLVLAVAGHLVPWLFWLVAIPCAIAALWGMHRWAEPRPDDASIEGVSRLGVAGVAVVLVVIAAVTVLNVRSSAEHLQTNRDPGVYLTTGEWLSGRGTLLIEGAVGGFSDIEGITADTQGYRGLRDDGVLYAQFNHGFPVLLALADWIGGDRLMLNLNPLIGGLLLALLFVLLARMFRLWIAVVVFMTAALNLVFWFFTRDTYSEPLVALLLVMALLAVQRAQDGSRIHWVVAGALVGSTALVRIDAWFYIAVFAVIIAVEVLRSAAEHTQMPSPSTGLATLITMWLFGVLGFVDLKLRSPQYLDDLASSITMLLSAALASGVLSLLLVGAANPEGRLIRLGRAAWALTERHLRIAAGTALAVFLLWTVFLRPAFSQAQGSHAGLVTGLMEREGIPADESRSFFELAGRWLTWYWGVPSVVFASVGAVLAATRRSFVARSRFWVPLSLCGIAMMPYLVKPSITPDQMWALRRFYPMALVAVAVGVGAVLAFAVDGARRFRRARVAVAVIASASVIGLPVAFAVPLATASTQVGMYGSTQELCANLPDDAAVLVEAGFLTQMYPAAVRSFCDVPVASLETHARDTATDQAGQQWAALDRSLFLLVRPITDLPDGSVIAASSFSFTYPERTLTKRPSTTSQEPFAWVLLKWQG